MSKYTISEDPMKHLDEEDGKIILELLKKSGKPIKKKYLKNVKRSGNKITIDLQIQKKKSVEEI